MSIAIATEPPFRSELLDTAPPAARTALLALPAGGGRLGVDGRPTSRETVRRWLGGAGVVWRRPTPVPEPTDPAAERALRHAVLWRKTSLGTEGRTGSHFVATVLTVVATYRQQGRNVVEYLMRCCNASLIGAPPPSLQPMACG